MVPHATDKNVRNSPPWVRVSFVGCKINSPC